MQATAAVVMAGVAAMVAGGAVWALQAGSPAGIDLTVGDPDQRAGNGNAPPRAPLEPVGRGGVVPASDPTATDAASLHQVLVEIRDELRALRDARGGAIPPVAAAPASGDSTGAPANAAGAPVAAPRLRPGVADIEAAIRAGEALALGREIARFRHYLEQQRHGEVDRVTEGDAEGQFAAQQAVSSYDRALTDLSTVRSFRALMAFYNRWKDDDHVSVIYPKWDR